MHFSSISSKKVKHLVRGRELFFVEPSVTVAALSVMMKSQNVGALAVMEDGVLKGIVSERDVVQRCIAVPDRDPHVITVGQIMTWPPITIDRNLSMGVAIVMMMEANIRHLPVMNGNRVIGMISIRQLVEEFRTGIESVFSRFAA